MTAIKDVLNAHEASRFLGVHVETIRRLARNGEIPAFKVGRGWRISRDVLLKWAAEQQLTEPRHAVLIVDDDPAVQGVMRRMLEKQGCRVHIAGNGAEGLAVLENHAVDAVFLDLEMPVMSGPDFLEKLSRRDTGVPVTVITGYLDGELMMEAGRYGPVTFLVKPIGKQPLLQALRQMLGKTNGSADRGRRQTAADPQKEGNIPGAGDSRGQR